MGGVVSVLNLPKKFTFLAKCDFWWPKCTSVGVLGFQEMAMFRREFCLSQLLKCSQAASREYKQYCDQSTKRLASISPLTHKVFLDMRLLFFGFAVNQSIQVKTSLVHL